jgi:hypothetical protein
MSLDGITTHLLDPCWNESDAPPSINEAIDLLEAKARAKGSSLVESHTRRSLVEGVSRLTGKITNWRDICTAVIGDLDAENSVVRSVKVGRLKS